jgi:hypothetical protein
MKSAKFKLGNPIALVVVTVVLVGGYVWLKNEQRSNLEKAGERWDRSKPEAEIKVQTEMVGTLASFRDVTPEYKRKFGLAADVFKAADSEWWSEYAGLDHAAKLRAANERHARMKLIVDPITDPVERVVAADRELRQIVKEMR